MKNKFLPILIAVCVTLTKSRKLACNSTMAGIQAIGIAPFDSTKKVVKTSTGVTSLATIYGADTIARFEVKNTTVKLVENGVSGGDNRSQSVKGVLPLVLTTGPGEEITLTAAVEQMMKGDVVLFIERKNGDVFAFGSQCGAWATTLVGDTGGQGGDMDGYVVTFNSDEPDFSRGYKLTGAALTDYAAALMDY